MSTPYEVKSGDWLQKIAEAHGFESWRDLYYHADNAAFRQLRPNPDLIYPGDIVMIPGETPPKEKPKEKPQSELEKVVAAKGDTFCSIATDHGFANCTELRELQENIDLFDPEWLLLPGDEVFIPETTEGSEQGETENTHEFQRLGVPGASIRFVHGSPSTPFKDDLTLDKLNISNYQTDKAGKKRDKTFCDHDKTEFDQDAHDDQDTFKVEVYDPRTGGDKFDIEIDALCPVYNDKGDKITDYQEFSGNRTVDTTEAGKRKLDTKVKLQGKGKDKRYRTCYLRLVVDEFDQGVKDAAGRKKQTLLVADMTEAAQAETDKDKAAELRRVEILDQRVRARYVIDSCPQADKKCRAEEVLVIGENHKRVEAAINILRAPANNKFDNAFEGTGVADIDVTRDWAMEFVRGIYAQADMGMKLVKHGIRYINAPANMFTVGARVTAGTPPETWTGVGAGPTAGGGSTMTVGVKVDGGTEETATITTVAGESPKKTVDRLAAEIKKKFPTVTIKTFENKRNNGQVGKTADILVGDPQTQKIELSIKALGEANHRCVVTRVTSTQIEEFRTHDSWVGTPQERILLYNYDEGKSHIDVFIVGSLDRGSVGEAFNPDFKEPNADFRANDNIVNSLIMEVAPIANDTFHTTLAHEMAHVLTDRVHIRVPDGSDRNEDQLLCEGSPVGADEKVVKGPKRIGDPPSTAANSAKIDFSSTDRGSFVEFLRKTNPTVITGWQATVALKDK